MRRDKVGLDISWLCDERLEDSAKLPDPDALAVEIPNDLEAALEQFASIAADLSASSANEWNDAEVECRKIPLAKHLHFNLFAAICVAARLLHKSLANN